MEEKVDVYSILIWRILLGWDLLLLVSALCSANIQPILIDSRRE